MSDKLGQIPPNFERVEIPDTCSTCQNAVRLRQSDPPFRCELFNVAVPKDGVCDEHVYSELKR